MNVRSCVHAFMRGPLRNHVRHFQAAHRLPFDAASAGPPDFVGIGAQRCGTSWWHSLLGQHPQVVPLGLGAKELHFFDDLWRGPVIGEDATKYAAQFRRRPGQLAGEWTPRYMFDPWAVPALLRLAPSARLLVMLRDPIARLESGLRHELRVSGKLTPDIVNTACMRGMYAQQLGPVLSSVPREQILVLQFEQCIRDVNGLLGKTFDFLRIGPAKIDPSAGRRNESTSGSSIPDSLADAVRPRYRLDAAQLAAMFPDDIDLDLWVRLR